MTKTLISRLTDAAAFLCAYSEQHAETCRLAAEALQKPKRAKNASEQQQFIDAWMLYYSLRHNGQKYPFGARDAKAVKTLLSHFSNEGGDGLEKTKAFIKACHARQNEGYPFSATETLYDLANGLARLLSALQKPKRNGAVPQWEAACYDPEEKF